MTIIQKEDLLDVVGEFTWMFGFTFFVETQFGNFVWRDPSYGGDNSVTPHSGSYDDFTKSSGMKLGRDKGIHRIRDYIGTEFDLIS